MMYSNRMELTFGEGPSLDEPSDHELNALERLEKYSQVEIPSYRLHACIDIEDALNFCHTKDDYERVRLVAIELTADQDLNVRVNMLDQLQFIGPHCVTNILCKDAMLDFITSTLLGSLMDPNHQVRKSAQSSLVVLANKELYRQGDLQRLFVDMIQDMLMPENNGSRYSSESYYSNSHELNDFPPEAVTLIAALASHLGGDVIVQKFLDRFIELCGDMLLHIRKCCASCFPKICQVVGVMVVEQKLLPVFSQLCNDDIWGVRKVCTEGFTTISESVGERGRVQILTPLFLQLLNDQSRYVKLAAYQQLGPFITTFQTVEEKRVEEELPTTRERTPTNPEYDTFLFWKPPVLDIDTEELEKELAPMTHSETSPDTNITADDTSPDTNTTADDTSPPTSVTTEDFVLLLRSDDIRSISSTDSAVLVDAFEVSDLASETPEVVTMPPEVVTMPPEAVTMPPEAVTMPPEVVTMSPEVVTMPPEAVTMPTEVVTMPPESVTMVEQSPDKDAVNNNDEEGVESMQVDEEQVQLRNFFHSLLKDKNPEGDHDKENKNEEEEVFDNNQTVRKSPDWGLTTPNNMNDFHKDPLTPKIIQLSGQPHNQDKHCKRDNIEDIEHVGGVLVGTIDITQPVFGEKQQDDNLVYRFTQKDEELELASDSSDMDIVETSSVSQATLTSPVPSALIECYTSMANIIDENNIRNDDDVLTHCAFAFPGVVYTLGRDYWALLRNTYLTLAENLPHSMSNVRQTLACSLHEIAHVIGPELTQQDLIHPFNNFIYDIDKVKIGLLKNLSKFLQHVSDVHRQELLHQMKEIQKCEDVKNWRYRQTFAQQLPQLCSLYTNKDVYDHIQPIIISLTLDQVAEVRKASFIALSQMLERFRLERQEEYYTTTCSNITNKFANSSKCFYRQSYILIVHALLQDEHFEIVERTFLTNLLEMATDRTPNVRLWVGQCLLIIHKNLKHAPVRDSLTRLQSDSDSDVKHYSTYLMVESSCY